MTTTARTPQELRTEILRQLRYAPLDAYSIAHALDEAPFRIRAELKYLRRERLVYDAHRSAGHLWALTERGNAVAWATEQTRINL